jgi:hypothetical protein
MRKQDYLIGLISALEPSEKRYFKLFSSLRKGEKRYLNLFDALENKNKYEGAELCAELGLEPWQLADDKLYLTHTLLQSLRNYDQESTEIAIVRSNIENLHSLISRRMFNFAMDLTEKTLVRAWELEGFELIGSLLVHRRNCWLNLRQNPESDDTLKQHEKAAICLKEIIELMCLRNQVRNQELKAANAEQFEKILTHPLLKANANKLKSLRAKSLWYQVYWHYYSSLVDENASLKLSIKERQLYLKHPEIKIINPLAYITNVYHIAIVEQDKEKRQHAIESLQTELNNPEIKISAQLHDSMLWTCNLISVWNLRSLYKFKQALPIIEKVYGLIAGRTDYDRFTATFEYALILLHNGKYETAADKVDELMRVKSDIRFDMQPFVRVMHVMAQLSLGNYGIMPHVVKSVRGWMKKNESEHEELNILLKQAGLISKAANKKAAWKTFSQKTEEGNLPTITKLLQLDAWAKLMLKVQREN